MDGISSETNMAELWASYHSALGLAGGRPPTRNLRDQPVSFKVTSQRRRLMLHFEKLKM